MRLTFNLSHFIACLCVHHSFTVGTRICIPSSFSLLGVKHKCQPTARHSCWNLPHLESLLCYGISSTQSPTNSPLHCWDFPHSEVKNLQVPLMGLPPFGNNTTSLPNRPHAKSNISKLKPVLRRDMVDSEHDQR